jgi:hypothetical protein
LGNDIASRLNKLVGCKGLVKIQGNGEIGFTVLSVQLPLQVPVAHDYESAVEFSTFSVRLDEGAQIDGKNVLDIPGSAISQLTRPLEAN